MLWVMTSRRSEIVHRVLELVEVMMLESRRNEATVYLWFVWAFGESCEVYLDLAVGCV
jgi:hypothetical protein